MNSKDPKDLPLGIRPLMTPSEIEAIYAAIIPVIASQNSGCSCFVDTESCDVDDPRQQPIITALIGHLAGHEQSWRLTISLIGGVHKTLRLHLDVIPRSGIAPLQEIDMSQATEMVDAILERIATMQRLFGLYPTSSTD